MASRAGRPAIPDETFSMPCPQSTAEGNGAESMRLVLLPGLDGTGELFAPFTDALAGVNVQVISYPPDRPMNYAGHEAHVRERLPKSEDYVLLAESFSGPVGISIDASAPSNLRGLILCCSFASNPLPVFGPLSRLI